VKVNRRRGRLRLELEQPEVDLLLMLLDELDDVLQGVADTDDAVLQRLNPVAYPDDVEAEADYRTLTEASLRSERNERMGACRADLAQSGDIDLDDPEAARRWIQVLNDLRLALGTRLGITEEDDQDIDPADPAAQSRLVYYWLTAVQDSVVRRLT